MWVSPGLFRGKARSSAGGWQVIGLVVNLVVVFRKAGLAVLGVGAGASVGGEWDRGPRGGSGGCAW